MYSNLRRIHVFQKFKSVTGFVTPGPSNAALSCITARQLCSEDSVCSQILEILPKVCGLELGKTDCNISEHGNNALILL